MKRKYRILDILLYLVFAFYLFLLLAILFRTKHSIRSLNLIPFHSINAYIAGNDNVMRSFALSNVLGNVVIFVPLGVYLALFNQSAKKVGTILWMFLFSVIVEIIQYIFRLGIGDIDDVILNSLGGVIGLGLYHLLWIICNDKNQVRNVIAICAPICGILSFAILIIINI
ncbi:MAG: VanZ family protein [Lachnospiraceae bacterium]